MSLKIGTNVTSLVVQKNLNQKGREISSELEKLSSGNRINKSSDDAVGLAIATKLDSETRSLRQAERNANDGISLIQTAEGGLEEISNILGRLRELTVYSASDTISDSERGFLDKEYQNLLSEVDRIANVSIFNGNSLLNGTSGKLSVQVGAFNSDNDVITIDVKSLNSSASNLKISGSGVASRSDAKKAISNVDRAIARLSENRAIVGSVHNRLNTTVSHLEKQILGNENSRATIMDADIAQSAAKLASASVLQNAGISALVQANSTPNMALRLLG
jgi:flagellin